MQVIFSIGTNLGNKKQNIENAIFLLNNYVNILKCSVVYETEPVGFREQDWFFNCVLIADTLLSPMEILNVCKEMENILGRNKNAARWTERIIDIDILLYEDLIFDTEQLTIPHKHLHLRNFVLKPLYDIAPNTIHPILKKTITQLLKECPDNGIVKPISK